MKKNIDEQHIKYEEMFATQHSEIETLKKALEESRKSQKRREECEDQVGREVMEMEVQGKRKRGQPKRR